MDTLLLEGCSDSVNIINFHDESIPIISPEHAHSAGIRNCNLVDNAFSILPDDQSHGNMMLNSHVPAAVPIFGPDLPSRYSRVSPDEKTDHQVSGFPDDCLKYISEILMEEDLDDQTTSFYDYTALQATEKSLYDALGEACPASSDEYPPFFGQRKESPDDNFYQSYSSQGSSGDATADNLVRSSISPGFNSSPGGSYDSLSELAKGSAHFPASILSDLQSISDEAAKFNLHKEPNCLISQVTVRRETYYKSYYKVNGSRGRKNLTKDDIEYEGERKSKHFAAYSEEHVEMEQYDDVLLCNEHGHSNMSCDCRDGSSDDGEIGKSKGSKKKVTPRKKADQGETIDLMTLLTQCAQAVATFDLRNANELLKKIRLHSSPYGKSTQRLAHYFANALDARMAGTAWQQCKDLSSQRITFSMVMKAYREQVTAIPFRRASYFTANEAITKLAEKATRIHIIDFGIFFGFQWPGLIQELSKRPVGPPMLRITGIDYPESGYRPAQRVEETGERLAEYCKRFNVPFEYRAIAKGWEGITPEELDIKKDELLVVNCLYMSRKLVDETVEENNPRDTFLRLIRSLNPDLFIHGIVNGTYSAPFFMTRFKEALFHYSSLFDMFEATLPHESEERVLVENYLHGKDALNVVACEGAERVERPETYRQWQTRMQRTGFRKVPLGYEAVKRVKDHVKMNHHKDFLVDDDGYWMLQGWKGRILYAVSCWSLV